MAFAKVTNGEFSQGIQVIFAVSQNMPHQRDGIFLRGS